MVKTRNQQLHATLTNTNTQETTTRAKREFPPHLNSKERSPAPIRICSKYHPDDEEEEEEIEKMREERHLADVLRAYKMHFDRRKEMPKHLAAVIVSVQHSRAGPPSPKSQRVALANEFTSSMSEIDALIHLEDYLGYSPASALNGRGEEFISRSHNQLWDATSVPKPNTEHDDYLEAGLQTLGCPLKPKPDIAYGYSMLSFSDPEKIRLGFLSYLTQVNGSEPYFPFLIFEWKSDSESSLHARLRAMRDGAAAVNTLRQFFIETGTKTPSEDDTAVFCAHVGPERIEIFVSWRRDDPKEGVSWEMDMMFKGELDRADEVSQARSVLLNILNWARQKRLRRIKAAFGPSKRGLAVDEGSPPRKRRRIG